jgi:3-methyladenine DNA glycosylase AlkC
MKEKNAFKNWINPKVVEKISQAFLTVYPKFNSKEFKKVSIQLENLELKARVLIISRELKKHLPDNYQISIELITKVLKMDKLKGFELWPISEYISQNGLEHFEESMQAMYLLTQQFTSEFAIRPFFVKDHQKVLKYFHRWSKDKNHHVRRWVSEGSRPLLPWGLKLSTFIDSPQLTISLLENLKFDEELYVRKSVSNHLNDISKHHPDLVIKTLQEWEKGCPKVHLQKINWIKRQALRTLIKKGNLKALKLMGVNSKTEIKISGFKLNQNKFKLNDKLIFEFKLTSLSNKEQTLVIDYKIDFIKSNGKHSPKIFKLKTVKLEAKKSLTIKKSHDLRAITTMKYYKGKHKLSIQVNGAICSEVIWDFNP